MSQTQMNLLKAYAGESLARNKYTLFAKVARKEGQEFIATIFEETAGNERAHAEELYEQIQTEVKTTQELNLHAFGTTSDNLKLAAAGEKYEWTTMYPDYEQIALAENEVQAANLFSHLKAVEAKHEERYLILSSKLDSKTLYDPGVELEWKCLNCGYIHKGTTPPKNCPVCIKAFSWYMPLNLVH